jgi:pyruvate kinase
MRRYRNTKIVATLGPASSTAERIEELFRAGVDVFRLNFSHGSHRDHAERRRVIREVEGDAIYQQIINASHDEPEPTVSDAITLAARQVAETVSASCIVTYTTSGSTTVRASRERPAVPILCVTANERTARRLAMAWGVHAVHVEQEQRFSAVVKRAVEVAKSEEFGKPGEKIVITAGVPMGTPGSTNVLRVERIP